MMLSSYHKLTTRILLFCCVLVLLVVNADSKVVSGEETPTTNSREFTKSIRQIEALPDQDEVGWHQAEAALRRAMLNPNLKENAICGLAWLYLRRGNVEAVSRLQGKLASVFPAPSLNLESQLGRIRLYHSLVAEPAAAQENYASLAASVLDPNVSESNRIAGAAMLGAISGMLKPDVAYLPIDRELLTKVRSDILKSPMPKIIQSFEDHYRKNGDRSTALAQWLEKHSKMSDLEKAKLVETEVNNLKVELEEQNKLFSSEKEEERQLEKKIFALTKEKTTAKQEVNRVDLQWDRHPEYHNPILPSRDQFARGVRTGETEYDGLDQRTVFRSEYVNGRRQTFADVVTYPRYRWNPRPQHLIEKEIDSKYGPAVQRFQFLSSQRESLRNRKSQLTTRIAEIEKELAPLTVKLESISKLLQTEMKGRKEIKEELQLCHDAEIAIKAAKPHLAFRPPHFEIVELGVEAKVLSSIAR